MADSLEVMGEMLPPEQWAVRIEADGSAIVCVTQLNQRRYWYTVKDVKQAGGGLGWLLP